MQPIPFLVRLLSVSIMPPSPSYRGTCHELVLPDVAAPPCVHPQAEGWSHRPCPSAITDQHLHAGFERTWTSPLGSVSASRAASRCVCVHSRRSRPGHPARRGPHCAPASGSILARAGVGCFHSSCSAKSADCPLPRPSRAGPSSLDTSGPLRVPGRPHAFMPVASFLPTVENLRRRGAEASVLRRLLPHGVSFSPWCLQSMGCLLRRPGSRFLFVDTVPEMFYPTRGHEDFLPHFAFRPGPRVEGIFAYGAGHASKPSFARGPPSSHAFC